MYHWDVRQMPDIHTSHFCPPPSWAISRRARSSHRTSPPLLRHQWIRVAEISIADVDGILNHNQVMTRMREIVGHMLTTTMTRSASRILTTIIDKHSRGEDIDDDLSEDVRMNRDPCSRLESLSFRGKT